MSTLIERAADAIGDTLNQKTTQETLEAAARAALATTREPSGAMILAGAKIGNWPKEMWIAMHDKMMEE